MMDESNGKVCLLGWYEQATIARALIELRDREPEAVPARLHHLWTSSGRCASVIRYDDYENEIEKDEDA